MIRIPRLLVTVLLVVGLGALSACSSDDSSDEGSSSGAEASTDDSTGTEEDFGRVVALGEEFVLADLLSLGVVPVASTATVYEEAFQGLDDNEGVDQATIDGITPLPSDEANLELLAEQDADTIVAWQFIEEELGADILAQLADEVIIIPEGATTEEQVQFLGETFGRDDEAAAIVEELDAERTAAAGAVGDDCEVSAVTIYAGPTPAILADGPTTVPSALQDVGCTLVPGPDEVDVDQIGRAYVSQEQLGLLDGPKLVMVQSEAVEGEDGAVAEIEESTLWQNLPAVQDGEVHMIDRLGYPGAVGQTRLYGELAELLGEGGS